MFYPIMRRRGLKLVVDNKYVDRLDGKYSDKTSWARLRTILENNHIYVCGSFSNIILYVLLNNNIFYRALECLSLDMW